MEFLILIFGIVILVFVFICIEFYSVYKQLKQKLLELSIDYSSADSERKCWETEYEILEKEVNFLKEEEYEKLKKEPIIVSNKKLKIKSTFKNKKVLIGDYNKEMLRHTRKIFLSLGFAVDTVQSGDDLIQKVLCGNDYDVIVTNNIYRNSCDGPDVLRELREIDSLSAPIVVLTISTGQKEKFINEIGFDGYLEKMLTQKQAEEVMRELLLNKKSD